MADEYLFTLMKMKIITIKGGKLMDYNAFLNKTLDINDLPLAWREKVQEKL